MKDELKGGVEMRKLKNYLKNICICILVLSLTACSFNNVGIETETSKSQEDFQLQQELDSLFGQFKFNEFKNLLDEKYKEGIKDIDVLQKYAYIEFYLYEEYDKAEDIAIEAIELEPEKSTSNLVLGEIYFKRSEYKKAIKSYEKAVKNNENYKKNKWDYEMSMAYFSIAKTYLKLGNDNKAINNLEKCREVNPYHMEANSLLHQLYVEKEKYEKAYDVWKTDNYIIDDKEPILKGTKNLNQLYKAGLEDKKNHYKMADLYSKLLLYDEAKLEYERALKKDKANKDIQSKLNEINVFITFRDELEAYFDDYYRRRCIEGQLAEKGVYIELKPIYEKVAVLFPDINASKANVTRWINEIDEKVRDKFNVEIEYINANRAYFGCHFGYIIDDFSTKVSQWGRERDLRLVVLKNMVSNGVWDWLTNGDAKVGGWSNGTDVIVSVLRGNGVGIYPLMILDDEYRKKELDDAAKYDGDLSHKAPLELFYSKTLANQFTIKALDHEVQKAKEEGYSDSEIKNYMCNRTFEHFINTTIIVHEGQHALDSKYNVNNTWLGENEYRPKMSELSYGDMQFATLNQFYELSIGSDMNDTHTRANTQVFKDIVQYIYDNSEKYPEIDTSKSILLQLIKLEEEDIREIAINIFESKYPDENYE